MDEKQRLLQIRSKARDYRSLLSNPEFAKFKAEQIDSRLKMLESSIYEADLSTEEGKRRLVNEVALYQQLKAIFVDVFTNYEVADQSAKALIDKRLKEKA